MLTYLSAPDPGSGVTLLEYWPFVQFFLSQYFLFSPSGPKKAGNPELILTCPLSYSVSIFL